MKTDFVFSFSGLFVSCSLQFSITNTPHENSVYKQTHISQYQLIKTQVPGIEVSRGTERAAFCLWLWSEVQLNNLEHLFEREERSSRERFKSEIHRDGQMCVPVGLQGVHRCHLRNASKGSSPDRRPIAPACFFCLFFSTHFFLFLYPLSCLYSLYHDSIILWRVWLKYHLSLNALLGCYLHCPHVLEVLLTVAQLLHPRSSYCNTWSLPLLVGSSSFS